MKHLDSISPADLLTLLNKEPPPILLDVRRDAAFSASSKALVGAQRCTTQALATWVQDNQLYQNRTVVVYCVYGHEVGREASAQLRALGWQALYLAGGIEGGEDGIDLAADIESWRSVKLPMSIKTF